MIFNNLRIVRSLCSWSSWPNRSNKDGFKDGFTLPKTRVALVLLGALPLSTFAHGQTGQPTVTALPYVLTYTGGIEVVATSTPMKQVPPAVGISTFGSLFGGGFAAATSSLPLSTAAIAATFATKKLVIIKNNNAYQKQEVQLQQNAQRQLEDIDSEVENEDVCIINPNVRLVVLPNGTFGLRPKSNSVSNSANLHHASSRTMARRTGRALPMLAAADTCELPEEQNADKMEADLEALNESETATEDALETAEAAAEAAEAAAEAAETAIEGALEAAEIMETILEACSLF
jgi:hypothetical protein